MQPAYGMSFYEFDDQKDIESYGVLMCDMVHCVPPMSPLYFNVGWYWYNYGVRYAAETLSLPTTPGVAEGMARVIMTVEHLKDLKPDEILVSPGTTASWTPAFNIIKGLICDGGGALSHPIIVAREYGIPCVVGRVKATSQIKTGQRVRVDGDHAAIYILDK